MAIFSKFFGRTIGEAAAFALGGAMRSPLEPPLVELTNETWAKFVDAGITVPTEPGDAADIAAEDVASVAWAKDQARQRGTGGDQMDKLIGAALNAPGAGELLRMLRRGTIKPADFIHGLRKAKLEQRWDGPVAELKDERLDPAVVARAIQRGLIRDPGILPVGPPSGAGKVPAFPVFNVDALSEALASGIDKDRLGVEVGLVGNPMGAHEAAQAFFRGILEDNDYLRAIAEGNTRNEWADPIREQSRQIPSVTNYVEARVRGWITPEQMNAGIARHGMTSDDGELEFLIHGRPLSWHQVFIGQRRGGVYDGPTTAIDAPFLKALQESNIRPEWYSIAWAQRYSYPAAFVLRGLTQDHDVTQAEAEQILLFEGWEPALAKTVTTKWAATTATTKADPAVKTAQTKFLTALHKAFVGGAITDAQGVQQLGLAGISADAQTGVLDYWRKERTLEAIPPPPA